MPPHLQIPTLDGLSKHFAPVLALKKVRGPRSLRRSLRDANGLPISQAQLGGLLAILAGNIGDVNGGLQRFNPAEYGERGCLANRRCHFE